MNAKEKRFVQTVKTFYTEQGRHALPWRKTTNPYRILVSEIMLQQTQVDRVLPKYKAFLKRFPTVQKLATAPLSEVLIAWQGLGYNRRAKMLHQCAKLVASEYGGTFPKTLLELQKLPGVGPYTASAVCAFAYNTEVVLIETNVRTVYIHHFFNNQTDVHDVEILKRVEKTLDRESPREWYWAIMDYGSHLKKHVGNLNNQSKHYVKQSKFVGSDRQIRGAILRILSTQEKGTRAAFLKKLSAFEDIRIDAQLEKLVAEQMLQKQGRSYRLPV